MTVSYANSILDELSRFLCQTDEEAVESLIKGIRQAKSIFVAGAGRSGLMLKAFAMRLMQLGFRVYVVGETVTPAIAAGDLLIIGSGSGETPGLLLNAKKAASLGANVALVTTNPHSAAAREADIIVHISASTEKLSGERKSIQPGGSAFEQCLLLLGDAIVMRIMENMGDKASVMKLHANLE